MISVKIIQEELQLKHGEHDFYTVWIKDEDFDDWCFMQILEDLDMRILSIVSSVLNQWSDEYSNEIDKTIDYFDCELCGQYEVIDIKVTFRNGKVVEEHYSGHFGTGTSREELIEQLKMVGVNLLLEL